MKDKIVAKGTKIKLWCCTHDRGSDDERIIILDDDYNENELEEMAKEFMYESKEPEYGWKITE
jgi:hypothetical protein